MKNLPENALQIILNTISCGVFTVDADWKITFFNDAMTEITGVQEKDAIGRQCREVLRGDICSGNCALRETLATGAKIVNRPFELIDSKGRQKSVAISTAVFRNEEGLILGGLETVRDLSVLEELRKKINGRYQLNDIISKNHEMGKIFDILPKIAKSSCSVLIGGESGTGKELIARAIHSLSFRKNKPFIALNCAALPDALLESELFGYRRGAFTDAKADKKGRVELAKDGTLFLDEIGDISPAFQAKLLRFLQDRSYVPLGGQQQLFSNVRVVAATNKKLKEMVYTGLFREDLYFRLNVAEINLPPLRSRLEDIPLLVACFIERFNAQQGKSIQGLSQDSLILLMNHDFPGNVRELENIIEYAFIMCEGETILPNHLPVSLTGLGKGISSPFEHVSQTLEHLEAVHISSLLTTCGNDCVQVAKELGIHTSTLYRKMRKYNIPTPARGRK